MVNGNPDCMAVGIFYYPNSRIVDEITIIMTENARAERVK